MKKIGYLLLFVSVFAFVQDTGYSLDELMGITKPTMKGGNFNLRPEVADAFVKMRTAAQKDGIGMYSLSSYRSYDHQTRIWNRKWDRYQNQGMKGLSIARKIIEYSTIPGTSRHHWGTDLDVIDANVQVGGDKLLPRNYEKGGVYEKLGNWLRANSETYGFYLVYTNKPTRKGFKYEPWHLSYKKMAQPMLKSYLSKGWKAKVRQVKGGEFMSDEFIEQYAKENIQDINPDLL